MLRGGRKKGRGIFDVGAGGAVTVTRLGGSIRRRDEAANDWEQ